MPESGTYGSVRGVPGNRHPYRDHNLYKWVIFRSASTDCGHGVVRDAPDRHFEVLRAFVGH